MQLQSLIESLDIKCKARREEQRIILEKIRNWVRDNEITWTNEVQKALGDYNNWKLFDRQKGQYRFSYNLDILVPNKWNNEINTLKILAVINKNLKLRGVPSEITSHMSSGTSDSMTIFLNSIYVFDEKMVEGYRLCNLKKEEAELKRTEHLENGRKIAEKLKQEKERKEYETARDSIDSQIDEAFKNFKNLESWHAVRHRNGVYILESKFYFKVPYAASDLKDIIRNIVTHKFEVEFNDEFELLFINYTNCFVCAIKYNPPV